jgi:glycosyltransferase involved in cell wall biosynthesis
MKPPSSKPAVLPILFLVTHLDTGGAERQLASLVARMDRKRFHPIVACQKGGGPFYDEIVARGTEAYRFGIHGKLDPRFPWRLASLCRRKRVRAIVIQGFSTSVVGRLIAKLLGIRAIMAEHATGRIDMDPKKRPLERLLAPWTDGVIAVARGQIPFLVRDKGFEESQVRVIYNGIDLADWSPLPRSESVLREFGIPAKAPVVGILAMLRPEKDHDTFLRGARIVLDALPEAFFLIVGEGPERGRLEQLSRELGLEKRAIFTGRRTDVSRLLSVFDVAVLTSVTVETFPMSFLEAMALERPLVATPAGGVPEMIEEGRNGYLVPMRDPRALAEALVKIIADRSIAHAMGRASREIVENKFTIQKMVEDTENYLESLIRTRR